MRTKKEGKQKSNILLKILVIAIFIGIIAIVINLAPNYIRKEIKDKMNIIRNSVDLSVSVLDLEKQFNYTNETIDKLEYVENKEKLVEALTGMKKNLEKLKTLSLEHDSNISKKEPLLTPEILENEKTLYLERRIKESIDCC